jgi:SOS response regulatory protein OraA/RecX
MTEPANGQTQAGDGERLATVTYLFGATPSAEQYVPEKPEATQFPAAPVSASSDDRRSPREAAGKFDRLSNVSMYALARRGMSSREMRDYLVSRDFDADEIDEEVTRLEGVGLLDDEALAETLVRTLRDRKGLGKQALSAELRRRHVDVVAIEEALGNVADDELERAIAIAEKRAPQLRSVDSETAKRRLGAFLMRKGYSGSVVSTAVQRALAPSGPTFH